MSDPPPTYQHWGNMVRQAHLSTTKPAPRGICTTLVRRCLGITIDPATDNGHVKQSPFPAIRPSCICTRNLRFVFLYLLAVVFSLLLVADVAHLASGGEYEETPYGRDNPMISLLGFCSSQITLTMSFVATVFLIRQAGNIAKSAQMLDQLLATFSHCCAKTSIVSQKTYVLKFFAFFLLAGIAKFACATSERDIMDGFYNETTYVWLHFPTGAVKLYNEMCMLLAMIMYIPVTAIFTYFCSILVTCLQAFRTENEELLRAVDPAFSKDEISPVNESYYKGYEAETISSFPGISTEEFVARLKIMRIHHEAINDTYDQLQMTFGFKLLLDIVTNVFALLSVIAWFSMWSVNSELANTETGAWNGISAVIYAASLWLVCNQPLLLQNKHGKMVDEIEKVLYRRQMVKHMKPSREEISITFALRQRLKTKILSFSAGGVLDIHGMAVSLVAGLAGFVAFIMERIEDFKAHMDAHAAAEGTSVNVTCGSGTH